MRGVLLHRGVGARLIGVVSSGFLFCPKEGGWATGQPSHGFAEAVLGSWTRGVGRGCA